MQEILYDYGLYVLAGLATILLYFVSRFAVGFAIARVIMKIFTLGLVLFYSDKLISFFILGLQNILPNDNNMFVSALCQFGVLEGLNIYFILLMTVYFYKITIKVLIQS